MMTGFTNWAAKVGDTAYITLKLLLTLNFSNLSRLIRVNTAFDKKYIVGNFSNMMGMFFHTPISAKSTSPALLPETPGTLPDSFTFRGKTTSLSDWRKQRSLTAMIVLKDGAITFEDYYLGTNRRDQRISWSMAKSFLSALFGIAVSEGLLGSLDDLVVKYVPELKNTAYDGVTVRQVLNMASGVAFNEDYLDYHSDINRMGRVLALGDSMDGFAASLIARAREPGSRLKYVSIDTHVIGMVLRKITSRDVPDYMAEKLIIPMGLEYDSYYLTDGPGTAFVLGGMNLSTRDYARFGLLMANDGMLNGRQIVPKDWVRQSTADSALECADELVGTNEGLLRYGYQWWLPPEAEEGEFFAIGIYGQFIYVNRLKKTVVVINSADRDFKVGDGEVALSNLAFFRDIADHNG